MAARAAATPHLEPGFDIGAQAAASAINAQRELGREAGRGNIRAAAESARQATLLRCIVGNPFQMTAIDPAWRTSTVTDVASAAYGIREFAHGYLVHSHLAVLSDACEEAGCPSALLEHLRHAGPHVIGCWAVEAFITQPSPE